jgi:hypothetical protein
MVRPFGSSSENVPPSSLSRSHPTQQSRIPTKSKKVLGERIDNSSSVTETTRSLLPLPIEIKTATKPRQAISKPKIPRFSALNSSPAKSTPTPARSNSLAHLSNSQAGFTPHPRRSSAGFNLAFDNDETMLLDMAAPAFLVSDTDESGVETEAESVTPAPTELKSRSNGRAVMGEGRLMTPANSQETQVSRCQPTKNGAD